MGEERPPEGAIPRPEDLELIRLLRAMTVESDQFAEQFGALHGLHRTDMNALVVIMDAERRGEPMSPSQLSAALGLSASATTSLLDRLERTGHLYRDRSASDRRRITLVMPDKALDLGRAFFAPLGAEFARGWAGFSAADREVIARFLRTSITAMETVRDGWSKP